jgi:cellulose synthase/poly-beta-1,6-N-acetylglucosamine synthase-like glycosyltransferase
MSLGFILAIIALLVGSFFFLYAMKYYLTLAMVLWFSRRASRGFNGNGYHRNGNGNGYNGNGFNGNGHNGFYNSRYLNNYQPNGNGYHGNGNGGNGNGSNISHRSGLIVHDENYHVNGFNGNGNGHNDNGHNGNGDNNGNGNHQREAFFYRLFGNGNGHNGNHNGNGYHRNGNGNGYNGYHANGNGNGLGMIPNHEDVQFKKQPFVSIHLPFYNEKKVADRILTACTSLNYENYEVIVADDSTDETVEILEKWKAHPKVKIIHRPNREGWKGGALKYALTRSDPRTQFVIIFDADFIPYPDTIWQFLKYFNVGINVSSNGNGDGNGHNGNYGFNHNGNGYRNGYNGNGHNGSNSYNGNGNHIENGNFKDSNIAAVQGYQWHVLNKNENWITKGVRAEFAGSYVVERPGTEVLGSMKLIAGSVYMIRADLLKKYGWGKSITEDFELTLRLYADGYKVIYSPYIQTPSECVSTIKRLVRQRMRWAEGHTHNVRKMFWKILRSPFLNLREKLEFLYLCPYYLQAAFFLVGTLCWFASDAILQTPLPFWTALWGWCLVLTNLFALPLMNSVGLFLEESPKRDYLGIFSFMLTCYILVPFQAYAAVKGLFEKEEGHWFRTPKSGIITDVFSRFHFSRLFEALFPGRRKREAAYKSSEPEIDYLKPTTANNRFDKFGIKKRSLSWITNLVLIAFLTSSLGLGFLATFVPTGDFGQGEKNLKFLTTAAAAPLSKERIDSQMMTYFGDTQAIFHIEPRVRYKLKNNAEVEITTLSAGGLGKARRTDSYQEGPLFVYPEIFENADLIYRVRESRVNESLRLNQYQPIEYLEQRLRLIDLVLAKDDQGEISLAPKQGGEAVFTFQKPFMYEEKNPERRSEAIVYELQKKGSDYILRKTLTEDGKKWLSDPARQFPVLLDPTIYRSDVSAGIAAIEAQFGSNQRKIAYMPSALDGAAWYVFHADGNIIRYKKCFASTNCDAAGEWSANVPVDVDGDGGDNNPNIIVKGNYIWIAWIDQATAGTNACCNVIDSVQWRRLYTVDDTFNSECSSDDQSSLGTTAYAYIGVGDNGDVVIGQSDTAGDAEAELAEIPSGTSCAAPIDINGAAYTIEAASGLPTATTTMRPVAISIGNNIHIIYDDATNEIRHSLRDVNLNSWTFTDKEADNGNVLDDIFSVTTDGSSLWLLYRAAATTTVLQKCTGLCMSAGGTAWTNLTAPWTAGLTSADYPNLGYMPSPNDLKACINDGAAATTQDVVCKSTDASSISWGTQYSIGFADSDQAQLSLVHSCATDDQMAMVVHDVTNTTLRFATVPERALILLVLLPFLPVLIRRFNKRRFKCGVKQNPPALTRRGRPKP